MSRVRQSLFLLFAMSTFLGIEFIKAQDSTIVNFFPYSEGDFWVQELYVMDIYYSDERIRVTVDTLNTNGSKIYTLNSTIWGEYHYRIDTLGNIYSNWWYDFGDWVKIFDSTKRVGQTWVLQKDSLDPTFVQYELAEVMDSNFVEFFGDSTLVKEIQYARTDNDSLSTKEGYLRLYAYWADRFGLIRNRPLEFGGLEPRLKGAFIGDVVYGDTTFRKPVNIELEDKTTIPNKLFQLQNYPNPFNSSTNFSIKIEQENQFALLIYNQTGQLVSRVFENRVLVKGTYNVHWEAINMATGIYFAHLSSTKGVKVKTITLIK